MGPTPSLYLRLVEYPTVRLLYTANTLVCYGRVIAHLDGVIDELRHGVWNLAKVRFPRLCDGIEVRLIRHLEIHVYLKPSDTHANPK